MFRTIIPFCLCLALLVGCTDSEELKNETSLETDNQDTQEQAKDPDQNEEQQKSETETVVTEEEAVAIAKNLIAEFGQLMVEMGEENGWNFENQADYETAKPELLKVATEEFSNQTLKEYVESYYCSCDSVWFPGFNERTVRIETELSDGNSFTVKGLELPNYISGGNEITLFVKKEEGNWKLDGWEHENFIGKNMNFTKEEIQTAHPDMEIMEEQTLDEFDVTVYRAESEHEVIGISKKDGTLYNIE